ncbi:glycosyltransferase family 4 protein [Thiopseudomonas acetoxidans]|uniref:Glycosyltransferase family 4 protein n=1 Tax=Thiopseudomonas acetoxidans TaxID=3041622 RepID=A0ABT7SQN3_9GAMM|nr:glycosyltransferase family 4 protein [Thiopseudomonas sp. CY1220]MDM7858486.1 glycosyltransferase family 4 protein [Thiopseudomonas sp. CY1220]
MKSIALVTSHAPSLVAFRGVLITDLVTKGIQVWALAPNYDQETREAVIQLGAEPVDCSISRTGMNPVRDALDTMRLIFLLRRLKPDVVLNYFVKPVVFGSLAAFIARVPYRVAMIEGLGFVFTETGRPLSYQRKLLKAVVLRLYKIGLRCAHKVIFLNPDDRAELVGAGVVPHSKTWLLGGIGVDLQRWRPLPHVIAPVTFLLVARLLREKGIEQFAAAARQIKLQHPQVRFILLGGLDDNPGALSERDVQAWVDEGVLEWHGHTAVAPVMAQASVFVLPSWREGMPVSTQEAMASARAVITTDVPGCRQTVVDGLNGFVVPPPCYDLRGNYQCNSMALAAAMLRFVEQPELIEPMGMASLEMARKHYDVREANKRLMAVLFDKDVKQ